MDKIKKIIHFNIPVSICNFRCSYCYLAQRDEHYQGKQIKWEKTPEEFRAAFSKKRIGGAAFFNFCADGETLLVKDIDKYVKVLLEEGHYVEFVTNLTVTNVLDKFLAFDRDLLKRLEFKCSFHYLELKKRGLLATYANNVKRIWAAGASANIEITPSDDQLPFFDEIKGFSIENFGALPHVTIARNDKTKKIDYLTSLPMDDYNRAWSSFDSCFWDFKKTIFGKKQRGFCYAGGWSIYVNIVTGEARQCYCGKIIGNVFEDVDSPLPEEPIGKCGLSHCYNGHMLLTLGLIPEEAVNTRYGTIRDRVGADGFHWIQREYFDFVNTKLAESNSELSDSQRKKILMKSRVRSVLSFPVKVVKKIKRLFAK